MAVAFSAPVSGGRPLSRVDSLRELHFHNHRLDDFARCHLVDCFRAPDESRHRARRGLDFYGRDDGRVDRGHRCEIVAR